MKYNAINLLRHGADALRTTGDGGTAYALHEMANNLLEVMEGRSTMEQWKDCYTSKGSAPLDLDALFPDPAGSDAEDQASTPAEPAVVRTTAAEGWRRVIRAAHDRSFAGRTHAEALAAARTKDGHDPYAILRQALALVPDDASHPDEISQGLSSMADVLAAECAANRHADDWAFKAVTMGWLRTAAGDVWSSERP